MIRLKLKNYGIPKVRESKFRTIKECVIHYRRQLNIRGAQKIPTWLIYKTILTFFDDLRNKDMYNELPDWNNLLKANPDPLFGTTPIQAVCLEIESFFIIEGQLDISKIKKFTSFESTTDVINAMKDDLLRMLSNSGNKIIDYRNLDNVRAYINCTSQISPKSPVDEVKLVNQLNKAEEELTNNILKGKIKEKNMKVFRTKELVLENGIKRLVTVCVIRNEDGLLSAGYSVVHPQDLKNNDESLSKHIAIGRANSSKTNMLEPKEKQIKLIGNVRRSLLLTVADDLLKDIEKGKLLIKGIRILSSNQVTKSHHIAKQITKNSTYGIPSEVSYISNSSGKQILKD